MQPHRSREKADYTGLLALVMAAPIYFISLYFVNSEVAKYIGMCGAVHILAVKINWDLRRHFWLWGAIAVLFGIHIPVIMRIPWPTHWVPAFSLIPLGVADLAIVHGVIVFLEKLAKKWQPA